MSTRRQQLSWEPPLASPSYPKRTRNPSKRAKEANQGLRKADPVPTPIPDSSPEPSPTPATLTPIPDTPSPPKPAALPKPSNPKTRTRLSRLSDDEQLLLIRLCNQNALAWRSGDGVSFWKAITAAFENETGKTHSNVRRIVKLRIDRRRQALEEDKTGTTEGPESEASVQEDAWIAVLDEENRVVQDRKDRAAGQQAESSASQADRESLLLVYSQKQAPKPIEPRSKVAALVAHEMSQLDSDGEGFTLAEVNSQDDGNSDSETGSFPLTSASSTQGRSRGRGSRSVSRKRPRTDRYSGAIEGSNEPSIEASLAKMAEALADQAKEGSSRRPATRAEDIEARLTQFERSIQELKEGQSAMLTGIEKGQSAMLTMLESIAHKRGDSYL
jgi:hypothetical protein